MVAGCVKSLLSTVSLTQSSCRYISSKYFRPHPRSYRRRLYEAALAPILPPDIIAKKEKLENGDLYDFQPPAPSPNEFTEIEKAEVRMLRSWITEEKFRVLGICQILFVTESSRWLAQNQFRLRGLEFKSFNPKIIRKVFEGTPFSSLHTLHDNNTVLLFGREPDSLRSLVTETAKYNWLVLLAGTLDRRIFDVTTLQRMSSLSSLEDIRVETTRILGHLPMSLIQTLERVPRELVTSLDAIAHNNKSANVNS